jgi:DNA polymerase V
MGRNVSSSPIFSNASGWPSPSLDYAAIKIDLNQYLINDPTCSYILRMQGDSMVGAGIFDGDEIIVDRSIEPRNNHIVIAIVEDNFIIRRLLVDAHSAILKPENKKFPFYRVPEINDLRIWGVVTKTLHTVK